MSPNCDGKAYIKAAKKNGLRVERGRGDHVKIYGPAGRGYMIIPDRKVGKGLACEISKWFKLLGILVVLALGVIGINVIF